MSDVNIARSLFSYVIDAQIDGLASTIFTTTSGTPSVTSNKYRLNNAAVRTNFEVLFGETVFSVTIPTAPTAGHARRLGYRTYGPSGKGSIYFDITGTVLSAIVITNAGTTFTEVIPWNAAWTNTQTDFRLGWDEKSAIFTVGTGANKAQVNINVGITEYINVPAFLVAESTVADNMDLPCIILNNVGRLATLSSSGAISSIFPGTGATNLGKAEDAAHASGDVGIEMLAVRRDTAASSTATDGDYATVNTDSLGHVWGREGFVDLFVDNVLGIAGTQNKPVLGSTYAFSIDKSAALEASTIVNAGPCNLRLISGRIDSTAPTGTYYVQRINSTTLPADGAVTLLDAPTKFQHTSGTDTPVLIDYTMNTLYASTGAVVVLSTTDFTKTISGAYLSLTVMYKA